MKKNIFYVLLIFAFLFCGYLTFHLFHVSDKDLGKYQKIYFSSKKQDSDVKPATQKRSGVQKDIFFTRNEQRFHFKIFSEKSEITVANKKEIIENLENIVCLTQDKIFFDNTKQEPMQQLRYFTAKEGTYTYPSHKFTTNFMNLTLFEAPGSELPASVNGLKPYLAGTAKEVSFSLIDKMPTLSAYHFKAAVDFDKALLNFEKEIK